MINKKESDLLELLIKKNIISDDVANNIKAFVESGKGSIDNFLIEKKILSSEKIVELKAELADLPYLDTSEMAIGEDAMNIIPLEVAENYKIACLEKSEKKIKIGLIDPYNTQAIEAVNFLVQEQGLEVEYYLISEENLNTLFTRRKNLQKEVSTVLEKKQGATEKGEEQSAETGTMEDLTVEEDVSTAPVARIVSVIIRHAVEEKASDIHIEPMQKETRVRYRIDGLLRVSLVLPKSIHAAVVARIKVLSRLKLDETRVPQDGRIRLVVNKKEIDFRISVLPLMGEEKVVMRILDLGKGIPKMQDLGYDGRSLRVVEENIKKTYGIFLVTGPTGSGKSTTLASVLNSLNREDINIVTLEDPVEYYIKGVNQSQVRSSVGYTFASGLRSLLRQDPDVVMVGEIRDSETAELCIHAGLTGHFVLSTLHTNNAVDVIPRLLDMKVEPFLLGSTINTILAQRLARKICPNCRRQAKVTNDFVESIKEELKNVPKSVLEENMGASFSLDNINESLFFEGAGCSRCKNSGYSGRVAIVEIIDFNDELQNMIIDSKEIIKEEHIRKNQDFTTMKEDGILKALKGTTTVQEVLRVIQA